MEISVISFNIRCCSDPGGNSIAERAPRLAAVTSLYNADIIGFQEYRPEWETYIEKYYGDEFDIFNKYRSRKIDVESSPILWKKNKFECLNTGYFWLSETPDVESRGWDERFNCFRMCVYCVMKSKDTGEFFTVMNTHFGFGDSCQINSARLIYDYSVKVSEYPTFVVGDFNMTPQSRGYAAITKYFTDANAVTSNDLTSTYHGYNPAKYPDAHIDYCFTGRGVKPLSQKIIYDLADGKFPSDHYGLYIHLEI